MAEDPKVKAHNERMRQERIEQERAREARRRKEADEHTRRQIKMIDDQRLKDTGKGGTGCAIVFLLAGAIPAATLAIRLWS